VFAFGWSVKGDRASLDGSMGEYTVVASTNRGVRGSLSEDSFEDIDDPESVLALRSITSGAGRFFSSSVRLRLACAP